MTIYPIGTTVDTTNRQQGELLHMDFSLSNVTSIRFFAYIITVVCAKTKTLWIFSTASKQDPVSIIRFILKKLKNDGT